MPGRPPTAADLRAWAAMCDEQIRALSARIRGLSEEAHACREEADRLEGLPVTNKARTITDDNMAHADAERPETKRRGRPHKSKHPFPIAVKNVAKWAEKHGLDRKTVEHWYAPKNRQGRAIPRKWAEYIEKTTGVPAVEDVWRNGIS